MKTRMLLLAAGACAAAVAGVLLFTDTTPHETVDCPPDGERARVVGIEESSSNRDETQQAARLAFIREKLAQSAVCGGPLVVQAWSTSGQIITLWSASDTLDIEGGSEQARSNRVGPVADGAIEDILGPRFEEALEDLPTRQSDFLAWQTVAGDAVTQLQASDPDMPIDIYILSDGVQVDDEINLNQPLTVDEAIQLASTLPARVDLAGVDVTFIGIAQVDGPPPPAGGVWVDAVRAFAQATCDATEANCTVLSSSANQPS